jgi:hypothetical protein
MITTPQVFVLMRDGKLCGVFSTREKAEVAGFRMSKHFNESSHIYSVLDTFIDEPIR